MPALDRRANRVHLQLRSKAGGVGFRKPLIRWPEWVELEAGQCFVSAGCTGAEIDDRLIHRNQAAILERHPDPRQPRAEKPQILRLGGRTGFSLGDLALVRMEPSGEGEIEWFATVGPARRPRRALMPLVEATNR
jgi:hypothetical protein